MKQRNILTLILLCAALTLAAQSNYSPCYTSNMSKGNTAFNQGKYSEARTYYANAKQCAGGNPSAAQQKINACDAKIKAQKEAKRLQELKAKSSYSNGILTIDGIAYKMVYVEGGTFTMGCTSEQGNHCNSNEKPSHQVTLSDFWIGETEVTQALWEAVMGSNPSYFKGDKLPMGGVSWNDCQEFIRMLNQLTGKTFRLPTEAEWEFAARGGNKSRGYIYAGGNTIDDVAWSYHNADLRTHPVKTKLPNELGLYDMSGNVSEWCSDYYGEYNSSAQTNPTGPPSGSNRVFRGGNANWYVSGVSNRSEEAPDARGTFYGFRLVLVP